MSEFALNVDAALAEVPVNLFPLTDSTDFVSVEDSVAYNAAGLALYWNFVDTAGNQTRTQVTPANTGNYLWTNQGGGLYSVQLPATGGASVNNDTEGMGWFTGVATGVLPWRGPTIVFRSAALNNSLINGSDMLQVDVQQFGNAAGTFASGRPEINLSHIGGSALNTSAAQLGVNIVNAAGSAVSASGGLLNANVTQISGDSAAADALESYCDGTTPQPVSMTHIAGNALSGGTGAIPWFGIIDRGTAQAAPSSTSLQLRAALALANDVIIGSFVHIDTATTGAGQTAVIIDFDAASDTITVSPAWVVTPTGTITYVIFAAPRAPTAAGSLPGVQVAGMDADVITNTALAASAVTEMQSGLATSSSITTLTAYVDTEVAAILAAVDTEVAAIKAVTDNLPNSGTLSSLATASALSTLTAYVDTEVAAILAAVDTEVAAIKAVTDNLPNSGTLSSLATASAVSALAGYIDTEVAAIKATTDKLDTAVELDGGVYRFTVNALEQAPAGGGGGTTDWTADERTAIRAILGIPASGTTPADPSAGILDTIRDSIAAQNNLSQAEAQSAVASALAAYDAATGTDVTSATSGLATAAALATVAGYIDTEMASVLAAVDTEVAAIKTVTDALPNGGSLSSLATAAAVSTLQGFVDTEVASILAAVDTEVAAIKATADKLDTAMELDGAVYRFTVNALEQAPAGGGGGTTDWTADERTAIRAVLGIPSTGTTPTDPTAGILDTIRDAVVALNDINSSDVQAAAAAALAAYDAATGTDVTSATSGLATAAALSALAASVATILQDTGTDLPALINALNDVSVTQILTTQMTESYAATGTAPTLAQCLLAIHQRLMDFSISGTTRTVRRLDSVTTAFTSTFDDATNPTSETR